MTIAFKAMVLTAAGLTEVCWPISFASSEFSSSIAVACSDTSSATTVNLEIWRGF